MEFVHHPLDPFIHRHSIVQNLHLHIGMSQAKKRKIGFIDRAQTLSGSKKLPNIMPGTVATPCQRDRKYTFACKFKHRLTVPNKDSVLDAIVLENDICVLISKVPIVGVKNIEFSTKLNTDGVTGRMKKGALNLKAGSTICTIELTDGTMLELVTPVGGKLLELNEKLLVDPTLLELKPDSEGYMAVIYPDTEIPSLTGFTDYASLTESFAGRNVEKGVCFDFQQGSCSRGNGCRFKHKLVSTDQKPPVC